MYLILEQEGEKKMTAKVALQPGDSPVTIGIQLASATRVIAMAFCDAMKQAPEKAEEVEAIIVETYERDMKEFGSMNETVKLTGRVPSPGEQTPLDLAKSRSANECFREVCAAKSKLDSWEINAGDFDRLVREQIEKHQQVCRTLDTNPPE
jgi:hypothetical protein